MITIRPAVPEELPQLKDLWRKCFGDPSTYVDIFYQKFCPVEQVLVVDEVGELDSMAAMLPGTVHLPDGTDIPVGYVYALATNPYMQGKGHARQLLKYADEYLQKRGDYLGEQMKPFMADGAYAGAPLLRDGGHGRVLRHPEGRVPRLFPHR